MMSFNLINKGMWGDIYPLQKSQMGNPKSEFKLCGFCTHVVWTSKIQATYSGDIFLYLKSREANIIYIMEVSSQIVARL